MDRGTAMLAVVLDVYEGGKHLIPGWKLKEHAESALATGGIEGLRRYYEACLTCSGHRVKTTLERFMSIYLGAARCVGMTIPSSQTRSGIQAAVSLRAALRGGASGEEQSRRGPLSSIPHGRPGRLESVRLA